MKILVKIFVDSKDSPDVSKSFTLTLNQLINTQKDT